MKLGFSDHGVFIEFKTYIVYPNQFLSMDEKFPFVFANVCIDTHQRPSNMKMALI